MADISKSLNEEFNIILKRKDNPQQGSYTSYLFEKGLDKVLKKIGEESAEIIIAAKNTDNDELIGEICDMLFHTQVMMVQKGISWEEVAAKLDQRRQKENMQAEKEALRASENRTENRADY